MYNLFSSSPYPDVDVGPIDIRQQATSAPEQQQPDHLVAFVPNPSLRPHHAVLRDLDIGPFLDESTER